jgi:hypothetical protein
VGSSNGVTAAGAPSVVDQDRDVAQPGAEVRDAVLVAYIENPSLSA